MKEKTTMKEKLNKARDWYYDHEDGVLTVAYFAGCFAFGGLIGRGIGNAINNQFSNVREKGVGDCFYSLMKDNAENPEVIKALVDWNSKYLK